MIATFKDLKESRISSILGVCPDSDAFKSYVNEAIQRLLTRGNWPGSFQRIRFCVTDGCLTLPRQVAVITDIVSCGTPVSVKSQWFEFLENSNGLEPNNISCPGPMFIDRGFYPTLVDISGTNKQIRAYITKASDVGKKILIKGYDANNKWIRSTEDGVEIDGFYLTLASPFVQSTFDVHIISSIQKDKTDAEVPVYEVSTVTDELRLLARLEPSETASSYRRYQLTKLNNNCCSCSETTTLIGMAKLEYAPVDSDNDILFISCIPAIKEMCQSIRYGEMDTPQSQAQSIVKIKLAIKELNHQMTNLYPNDQTAIGLKTQGSAHLWKRSIGYLR